MIRLAAILKTYEKEFADTYKHLLLPGHFKAINALKECRGTHSPKMLMQCENKQCAHQTLVPHSCGHRHCPHCQNHETTRWINRQLQKQLPADYFMLTFTLPQQLRRLAWRHQRLVYRLLFECVWQTLKVFSFNDKKLGGMPGALAVLHTHSRQLDFHPHVHVVMPAATIDKIRRLWKQKDGKYLFSQRALATVFRAKMLDAFTVNGLKMPDIYPQKWVVDCQHVGKGDKALLYLGRYLYRGVIREKDILSCANGEVTFRYKNSKTKKYQTRTLKAVDFLWLVFQHILPRGFRRVREYGFWHANSKRLLKIIQWVFRIKPVQLLTTMRKRMRCPCCGSFMNILDTLLPVGFRLPALASP